MAGEYLRSECPNCGTPSLVSETAGGGGALTLAGEEVQAGDRVHRCDTCGAIAKAEPQKAQPARERKASARKKAKRAKKVKPRSGGSARSEPGFARVPAGTQETPEPGEGTPPAPEPQGGGDSGGDGT